MELGDSVCGTGKPIRGPYNGGATSRCPSGPAPTILTMADGPAQEPDIGYFGGGTSHVPAVPTTTTFEIPGATVTRSLGTCFGLVVRSMGIGKGIAASFRSMVGGEVRQYTE